MAYTKTAWQDLPNTTTPINATNLNHIETGIEDNDKRLNGTSVAGEMVVNSIKTKNLAKNTLNTQTIGSMAVTRNEDGSITLNGSSGSSVITLLIATVKLKGGKTYTLSGGSNLSADCRLDMRTTIGGSVYDNDWIAPSNPTKTVANDVTLYLTLRISASQSISNKKIYPMLEEGSSATTYYPYQELNVEIEDYEDISDLITKNTSTYDNLNIYYARAKKVGNTTTLNMIVRRNTGFTTGGSAQWLVQLPEKYRPANEIVSTCGMTADYTYPQWDGINSGRAVGFLRIEAGTGVVYVRYSGNSMKVAQIQITY